MLLLLFSEVKLSGKPLIQLVDLYTNLLHGVAVTDGNCLVIFGIEIVGDAVRSSDLILTTISLSDRSAVIVIAVVLVRQLLKYLLCRVIQLLGQRENRNLHRSKCRMEMHNCADIILLRIQNLFIVC